MPKVFTSKTQVRGKLGEDLAVLYLERKGYVIIERNYTRRLGEIDIVAEKNSILHFVEVKSVAKTSGIRPEENMHEKKLKSIYRTIEVYLAEKNNTEREWQLDLICIVLDEVGKKAQVKMIENIV